MTLPPRTDGITGGALDPEELLSHATWLRRFARALVRDDAAADDLVQDALGAAIASGSPIRNLRGFLGGVVRRRSLDVQRRASRRRRHEAARISESALAAPAVDESVARVETMRIVLEELERLPAAQRNAMTLRFVDGLTAAEIARCSGLTASTVRSNLARGLAVLRERLDERFDGRASWCVALAPWIGVSGPGTSTAPPSQATSPSSGVSPLPAGATGAAPVLGAFPMLVKPVAVVLAALALIVAWYWPGANADPVAPLPRSGAPATELAGVEVGRLPLSADPGKREAVVDPAESGGAGAAARVPFVGTVVDVLTGEPVPSFALRLLPLDASEATMLRGIGAIDGDASRSSAFDVDAVLRNPVAMLAYRAAGERSLELVTDARGQFALEGLDEFDSLLVTEEDAHGGPLFNLPRLYWHPFPAVLELPVRVGPTYLLASSIPEGIDPDDLVARLIGGSSIDLPVLHARLREGEPPWIRFQHEVADTSGDGPRTLRLATPDGYWIAEAEVASARGIEPEAVTLEFRRTGAVEFVVRLEGVPASDERIIHLEALGADDADGTEQAYLALEPEGPRLLGNSLHLAPGRYRWTRGTKSGEVDVAAGDTTTVELHDRIDGATFDAEVLVDATAIPAADLGDQWFDVFDARDLTRAFMVQAERDATGGIGGWRIELLDLPERAWKVVPLSPPAGLEWDAPFVTVEPGGEAPLLVARPSGPRTRILLCVTDAATGEPVNRVEAAVATGVPLGFHLPSATEPGRIALESIAASTPTEVLVGAPGYATRRLRVLPSRVGERLDVELELGWRVPLRVIQCEDLSPVENVEVVVGGRTAGRTDAFGTLWIEGEGPPKAIDLVSSASHLEVVSVLPNPSDESSGPGLVGYTIAVRRQ